MLPSQFTPPLPQHGRPKLHMSRDARLFPPQLGAAAQRQGRTLLVLALLLGFGAASGPLPRATGAVDGAVASAVTNDADFAAPVTVELLDGASERRLLIITTELNASGTALTLQLPNLSPIQCRQGTCTSFVAELFAGLEVTRIEINVDPDMFNAPKALLRVVKSSVDKAGAQSGDCLPGSINSAQYAFVNDPWAASGAPTTGGASATLQATPALTFKMGGKFRLCYSDDSSFTAPNVDLVPSILSVYGLFDSRPECATVDSCLVKREYHCYVLRQSFNNMLDSYWGNTSCIVQFDYIGAGFEGPPGQGSWSKAFGVIYDANGLVVSSSLTPHRCGALGDTPESFLCNSGGACDLGDPFSPINVTKPPNGGRLALPVARNDLMGNDSFRAYTVAACYCPDFDNCDSYSPDFVQQVGILHYYLSKACANGFLATGCNVDFTGAAPQHRFALRVECPTDACSSSGGSRIKIVAQSATNDLPAWDSAASCGAAVHGLNAAGRPVLPPDVNFIDVDNVHGGTRQDWKLWNFQNSSSGEYIYDRDSSGFLFKMGVTDHELRGSHDGETFDVCYCDDQCHANSKWFKVGHLRFAPFQLVSAALANATVQEMFILEYVNQPGVVGFYRPWTDYGVMGLQPNGMVKLVADSMLNIDDAGCVAAGHDRYLVERTNGLSELTASTTFKGTANVTMDPDKLIFNGGDLSNVITVKKPGFIAICYCSTVNTLDGSCALDNWILTTRITIRGPALGQSWSFSTHVVFRFEFSGWGLTSDDKVRIIPSTSTCEGDPNAAYTSTNIKLSCPDTCSQVGGVADVLNGDIEVSPLSDEAYKCNEQNVLCRTDYIKTVTVLDENTTALEFEAPPEMQDGDLITLGDNIYCHAEDPPDVCNDERLSILKGKYRLVDRDTNDVSAPDEYIAGHAITTTTNNKMVTIPVGWPSPRPRFDVVYVNNRRGRWMRHSKAITKEEIMGTRERSNMKICWKYAPSKREYGPQPTYVAQVGTLNLMDPNPLTLCKVTLTSTVVKQQAPYAPFILSFKTAAEETGKKYSQVQGTTRLRIFFHKVNHMRANFADGSPIEDNVGENEVGEARQYVCGKLFKELWSSDKELGFPMPKGCYYRTYDQTQELNILFDVKNGLESNEHYQLVMSGMAGEFAVENGEYAQIYTMDDTELQPYVAIERGVARLSRAPEHSWLGADGVKFLDPDGVKVVGGSGADMLELKDGQELRLELKGDPAAGGIKTSSIIRMFLWPLTQWDVPNSCVVRCIPFHEVTSPCGAIQDCKGDSLIQNFQKNYLRIVLPKNMVPMDNTISHTLSFPELTLPKGGFFPTRFALQLSQADDTKPHYTETVGDFLYKQPDDGEGVGKVVDFYGDGNHRPFREDRMNVLYARVILAATLFSVVQTGDARMTLTLPPGYECIRTVDIDGRSPWRVDTDLGVFGDQVPQGTGVPDEGSGARGWSVSANTCSYTLRQNAVVYAGSALTLRITVNNPSATLRASDVNNRWSVGLTSKGYHQWPVTFPPLVFKTGGAGNYSDNVAVLGRLTDTSMVPSNFAVSTDSFKVSMGHLQVFFRTEQETGVFSAVQLVAPQGFAFLPADACKASDLESAYYDTHTGQATRRLPGILGCVHVQMPFNHALISLRGSMLAQTFYGFKIDGVVNPIMYDLLQQDGWQIFTMSASNDRVDGVAGSIPLAPLNSTRAEGASTANRSFGLYQRALNTMGTTRVAISISEMLPCSITGRRALVTVLPLRVPVNATTTLRIVAPEGFLWNFTASEFNHQRNGSAAVSPELAAEVSADLPGGLPVQDGNVLLWGLAAYDPDETYGFQAFLHIPDAPTTASVNEFLVEFGHGETNLTGRIAASPVQAKSGGMPIPPPVRALVNAAVDYETNVQSKANLIVFQVETITLIPAGGGLKISGPASFVIDGTCSLLAAPAERDSPYNLVATSLALPESVTCTSVKRSNGGVEVHIAAGAGSNIPAGRYRFQIAATNPPDEMPNPVDGASPCGFQHCWLFESLKYLHDAASPLLDASLHVPCFAINRKLVEALMPALTPAQQAATGRNDRPREYNPLVFAFKLNRPALNIGFLKLRGPQGSVFRENCLEDIEVRGFKVFGEGQALPAMYAQWSIDIPVLSCRGEGPDAVLLIDPAGSARGLQQELLFPLRVALLHNPATPPDPNQWTMEYNGESSDPFNGYSLWKFSRTSIRTVSVGRSTPVTGADKLRVPVTFTFNPHNEVKGTGMKIKLTAPQNFQIAHTDYKCSLLVQSVTAVATGLEKDNDTAPEPNFVGPPSLVWGTADTDCAVDQANPRIMTATVLAANQEIRAGRDYQLTVRIHNPTITTQAGDWLLETEASPAQSGVLPTFRDSGLIPGYAVTERLSQWMYLNEDPVTKQGFFKGVTEVPGLYFEMQFPNKLEQNDVITVEAPTGFTFAGPRLPGAPAACGGFKWEPLQDSQYYLPNSVIQCEGGIMRFIVNEPKAIPEMRLIKFRVDTKNPPKTPHVMQNFWVCTHLDPTLTSIRSTSAIESWDILPQLYQVNVILTGTRKAEGSASAISVSFMPVSDADQLTLAARLPTGFDFTGCVARSVGHEVISTAVETVRVRATMYAGIQVSIVVEGLRLGLKGGPTEFDLVTRLNNGVQMDESRNFRGGFRLPGRVAVLQQSLISKYSQDPVKYPVSSIWDTRMGEAATAEFEFTLTLEAERDMVRLRAPPYELLPKDFSIVKSSDGIPITAEVISASSGTLIAKLGGPLWVNTRYKVSVSVVTPLVPRPTDAMWSIDVLDGNELPVNTNDALTEGFYLVDRIEVELSVARSPPMAVIRARLNIDPKSTGPSELILIAPPGFGFPNDCLANSGNSNEITACVRTAAVRGRAAAKLTCRSGGLRTKTDGVEIMITTPAQSATLPSWYIEGRSPTRQVGWGEDPNGVDIRQMIGAAVVYPGIPSVSGQMAFRFITSEKLDAGGKFEVGYPGSITISCDGAFLHKIALVGDVRCSNFPRDGKFTLSLSRPLPPGQQAFGVTSTCPFSVKEGNNFYVKVFDNADQVVDAAMEIPGGRIQHGLPLTVLPLVWSISEANKPAIVSLGFELLRDLPEQNPPIMSEIVVQLPRDFVQQIRKVTHIDLLNLPLPWRGTGRDWLVTTDPTKVNLLLDEAVTPNLDVGRYRFSFPVLVPSRMPKYNVFILTICGPLPPNVTSSKCAGESDPRALVSFPLAGFALGAVHPSAVMYSVTGSAEPCSAAVPWLVFASLLAWHSRP